jgi:S-adenosylmethionine hydrolase
LSRLPSCNIVDITHQVPPFSFIKAAHVLKNCFFHFPPGTIHIAGITTDAERITYVAVEYRGHYFLAPDNGFFAVLLEETPGKIIALPNKGKTFSIFEVLADAAILLAENGDLEKLGSVVEKLSERAIAMPYINGTSLIGQIAYIDVFRNIVTNIHRDLFEKARAGRKFQIDLRGHEITRIASNYDKEVEGELVALFNSNGFLEIALNRGDVAKLFSAKEGDNISISFV